MTITQKIWSLPIAVASVLALALLVAYSLSSSTLQLLARAEQTDYPYLNRAQALSTTLNGIQENLKNTVTSGDKGGLALAAEKAAAFRKTTDELAGISGRSEVAGTLRKQFDAYYEPAAEVAAIMVGVKQGDPSAAMQNMQSAQQTLTASLDTAITTARQDFEAGLKRSREYVERALYINIAASLAIAAGLGFFSLVIIRSITARLQDVLSRVRDLATGDADLTKEIPVRSADELGQISTSINTFVANLHRLVIRISEITAGVRQVSSQLAKASGHLAGESQAQADQAGEMAGSVAEIGGSISQVAENASTAAQSSRDAFDTATNSGAVIRQTIENMHSISNSVDQASSRVQQLGTSSEKIGAVVDTIRQLAEQTNLLALNAAIEAARAGEAGRGFAVVADEVRKLAEKSTRATGEISTIIKSIQGEIEQTVACIASGKDAATEGKNSAASAQTALDQIIASINGVNSLIRQIADVTEGQAVQAGNMKQLTERVSDIAQSTLTQTQQISTDSRSLDAATEQLGAAVATFKL